MARPRNPNPKLKGELADATLALLRAEGPESLSVRAIAAKAGVSSNAPFLYYPDGVPQLLAVGAIAGFTELREQLAQPFAGPALEWTQELVIRYVRFGVENANLYRAMFHVGLAQPLEKGTRFSQAEPTYSELRVLKQSTYEDLIAPLQRLQDEGALRGDADPGDAPGLALAAIAHGLVGEFIDEGLLHPDDKRAPWTRERLAMTVAVTDTLLRGLVAGDGATTDALSGGLPREDDERWTQYAETILEFFPDAKPIRVDLRRPLGEAREQLRERGLPDSFAVLTACNPRGRTIDDVENEQRSAELKRRVRDDGKIWVPVVGMSPDRRHREPSIAVATTQAEAQRIARGFEQSAFYWYDGSAFWLRGAFTVHVPVRLPRSD